MLLACSRVPDSRHTLNSVPFAVEFSFIDLALHLYVRTTDELMYITRPEASKLAFCEAGFMTTHSAMTFP